MLSVLVVTWNRVEFLKRTLTSVFQQEAVDFEVLVVDNGSIDTTEASIQALMKVHTNLHYTRLEKNCGVPAALNVAFEKAQGEVFFVMDDDEELVDALYLRKALDINKRHPWDLLTARILNEDGREEPFLSNPAWDEENFYVANFMNGAIFIRREVYENLGGMEGYYFRQGQENEYALRAILSGYHILYTREVALQHYKTADNRPDTDVIFYYACRNSMLKNYKYYTGFKLVFLNFWQWTQLFLRMLTGKVKAMTLIRAVLDYVKMKNKVTRILDYDNESMQRFYFLARKIARTPEEIGRLGFFQYATWGLQRFFK